MNQERKRGELGIEVKTNQHGVNGRCEKKCMSDMCNFGVEKI